jgi:HEAT repeat protein
LGALEEEDVEGRREIIKIFGSRINGNEHRRYWFSEEIYVGLIRRLEDEDTEVRKEAAGILGRCGIAAKDALPLLVGMRLNDPEESCRVAAKTAIESIEEEVL